MNEKQFSAFDIKWVKNVNDDVTNSAYLSQDLRLNQFPFFYLELNSRYISSLNKVSIGDLILLYQKLDNQRIKCFTHLITPFDNNVIQHPYPSTIQGWCGRKVKVIAMTGNQAINSIPVSQTIWSTMGFTDSLHNLTYQGSYIKEIPCNYKLPNLQNDIWNKFQSHIV